MSLPIPSPAPSVLVFSLDELAKTSPMVDGEILIWSKSPQCRTPLTDKITDLFGEKISVTQAQPDYRTTAITAELTKPEWTDMVEV